MTKIWKLGNFFLFSLLFTVSILLAQKKYAAASEIILPDEYYFVFNGQKKEAGTEYDMKSPEALLNITADGWAPETTVSWITSEPGVVELTDSTHGTNFVNLVRKGPGYSTITAVIKQGTNTFSLSCLVKVDLSFDIQKTGLITATTTNERILIFDNINDSKQIYLKYVDYIPEDGTEAVSGSAISLNAVTWESDNEGVATVDENGKVTAVGSGSAKISVTSNTMSSQDRSLTISLRVVVSPEFTLTYDAGGVQQVKDSSNDPKTATPAIGVPSNFVIESNATLAENLKWEVYDSSTGNKLSPASTKLSYSISDLSGNVSFNNVKAGTYEIYAFTNDKFNAGTNAPYAYMKIIVPIEISDLNLVMTVGDTYSLLDNSNIPDVNIFTYTYTQGNANIAQVDQEGLITANKKGNVRLHLVYQPEQELYDDQVILDGDVIVDMDLDITVIDGLALNTTSATLYTSGTLMLQALVTDPTVSLTWSSSDPTIATVVDGLVTGKKAGAAIITVQQKVDGVIKKASCEITVQQSVATITIDPEEVILPIGGYETLLAKITPANLSGVTLQWKSSNDNIVRIVDTNALTATIQGVAGGNAVISAINQDNVIVGYCHVSVQQAVTSIVLSESDITMDLSTKRVQLRATVYPENAFNKKVNWTTTDSKIATVNENGLVTLLKPGKVSIMATSDDNAKVRAVCNITVSIPVVSVALDETELTMYVGQTHRLPYLLLPANASNNSITWTSTNTSVATVDATGRVSAKGVGTTVIILETLDGGHSAYCTITVRKIATGVKFDVSKLELSSGEFYYIKAELTPKDSTDTNLVWESSDTKVVTVDEHGKIVAKDSGTAVVMARTEAGGMAYCKVTVNQPVQGLILNFSEKTIYVGDKFNLKVSVTPSKASELGVTWKSSKPEVATVNEDGEVKGLMGGTAIITCTTVDGGYSVTSVVTVREKINSLKLNYESLRIGKDKTVTLEAVASNQSATNQKVTWTSSNEKVATVTSKGKVTGVSYGFAIITATAQDGSEEEASCEVEVVKPVSRVTLNIGYLSMLVGEGKELKATLEPKNATYNKVTWISSDETIAVVDEDGFVTAISAGTATITAHARDNSGKKAVCYITVNNRVPSTGITVMDKKLVMVPGETKIIQVALNPVNSTDHFSWSTDNSGVAKVDKNTGKITARSTGSANITVMTDSGKTANIEIIVIGLNMTELSMEQYSQYNLYVEGATGNVRWDVENSEIATVQNGRVISRATGKTIITATVNGRRLQCRLTVTKIR